jgi:hypothetical protein
MTTAFRLNLPRATFAALLRGPFLCAVLTVSVVACNTEGKARKALAGTYVRQIDGQPGDFIREELTLRPNGTWYRKAWMETAYKTRGSNADSGDFHLREVTLTLRSFLREGVPYRYTVAGDSLFQANAAQAYMITGYDIGEAVLVRQR